MAGKISPRLSAAVLGCALVALNINTAWASGFAIREQSSTAQGNAFAGATAGAEDISYMFFNPAGLTYQDSSEVLGVASYIIPTSRAKNVEGTTGAAGNPAIQGGSNSGDIGEEALVPALYAMWAATPDLRFGLGINAPFGLVTDNDDDYVGRYHGTRSELETINDNPVVAYKATDWLSVGAGLQVQYVETQLKNAIDFGTLVLGAAGGGNPANDGAANLRGDDIAFGFNAGVLIDAWEGARIGLAYRSEIDHDIDGNVDFDLGPLGANAVAATGAFTATGANADFTSPDTASLGIYQDITEEWAIMGEMAWTDWSDFNELRIEFDNASQQDNVTVENWDDTLFFALGVTYKPKAVEGLSLRLGLAYDQTPIPDDTRTPRIPGNDRYWVSVGAGYKPFDWAEVTLSYTHIFMADGDVDLSIADDPNNDARGDLTATYEQHIDIVTLSGRIIF